MPSLKGGRPHADQRGQTPAFNHGQGTVLYTMCTFQNTTQMQIETTRLAIHHSPEKTSLTVQLYWKRRSQGETLDIN